jgi:hypothetical protein
MGYWAPLLKNFNNKLINVDEVLLSYSTLKS